MPKKATELSPLAVSRLEDSGFYFVGGVAGLALQILPTGSKSWILRATVGSKRRDMGLGGFPDVTLAGARESARVAREKIRNGTDPINERRGAHASLRLSQSNAVTFESAVKTYIETHEAGWSNPKHAQQWRNTLATYANPVVGKMLVRDIELRHVLTVLEPIWRTKTETATRVRSRIESVLGWATTKGYREGLNPARWKEHLDSQLPQASKVAKEKHHPALPFRDVGAFILKLRTLQGNGARALELAILTAARSGEIRGATWGEVDLANGEWVVPAARMKMDREHRVPLSTGALQLLEAMPRGGRADLIFPAPRGGELSDGTLNAVIKRMNEGDQPRWIDPKDGRPVVGHGFRSTFRDWVSETTNFPRDVAEMALAHAIGDKVEAAYRRGELFTKRTKMMQAWSDFCDRSTQSKSSVTPISKRA